MPRPTRRPRCKPRKPPSLPLFLTAQPPPPHRLSPALKLLLCLACLHMLSHLPAVVRPTLPHPPLPSWATWHPYLPQTSAHHDLHGPPEIAAQRHHHAHIHPRHMPHNATLSRRALRTTVQQPSTSPPPSLSVSAVVACHISTPCCFASLPATLHALFAQTLRPTSLHVLHACAAPVPTRHFHRVLTAVMANIAAAQGLPEPPVRAARACSARSARAYDECVLRAVAGAASNAAFVIVSSERAVLEPTAVEKLTLHLAFHPHTPAVFPLPYNATTLDLAHVHRDPMQIAPLFPSANHSLSHAVAPLPLVIRSSAAVALSVDANERHDDDHDDDHHHHQNALVVVWRRYVRILAATRVLREPLFTAARCRDGVHDLRAAQSLLSLRNAPLNESHVPAHLRSALALYRHSARLEEDEAYANSLSMPRVDLASLNPPRVRNGVPGKRFMFVMPYFEMGGSEKAMLDLAIWLTRVQGYELTFVMTMPYWAEDPIGEVIAQNEWINRALEITSDVIDIVKLAPNHLASKAFRYILESRRPDYILNSNTRWAYGHSAMIKAILPDVVLADYNHMIHMAWSGGGLPRFGANNSHYFDVHFTASRDVASPMEQWIDRKVLQRNPHKVKPCYVGTDPTLFHEGLAKSMARKEMRHKLKIGQGKTVVLFAGRFVMGKGISVVISAIKKIANLTELNDNLHFVFVGDGEERAALENVQRKHSNIIVLPPARGLTQMRDYYAMSDVLLLPSVNEGIALVLYEAMAAELLVLATDVGGQKELVTDQTDGLLIQNSLDGDLVTERVVQRLDDIVRQPELYYAMRRAGREKVRSEFTTRKFCNCVLDGIRTAEAQRREKKYRLRPVVADDALNMNEIASQLVYEARVEAGDALFKRRQVARTLAKSLTIGIKTYVCDEQTVDQVRSLVRSVRVNYPMVRVLLGNDGPMSLGDEEWLLNDPNTEELSLPKNTGISYGRNALVNATTTRYFALLDDDHVLDDTTNYVRVVQAMKKDGFDIVGLRVRNLPGIDELERIGLSIPRYVSRVLSLNNRKLVLCTWNENEGPSVYGMENAIPVNVLHNTFVANTDALRAHPWRNELEVNEHMTFFLDAWRAGVKVGYLPSEFVHHKARLYSKCYYKTRFREGRFAELLDYEERFMYDVACGREFPDEVRKHMGKSAYGQ